MTTGHALTPDRELVELVAERDLDAFAELYDRHASGMYGMIRTMVRPGGDAEDVLQEVFAQVWLRAGDYDPRRSTPRVWMGLLARSRALDLLRRKRRRPELRARAEPTTEESAATGAQRKEEAGRVNGALARLPEEQGRAIRLAFYSGMTHHEISEGESVPLGTVKTRIRLGMKRMRDILNQSGATP